METLRFATQSGRSRVAALRAKERHVAKYSFAQRPARRGKICAAGFRSGAGRSESGTGANIKLDFARGRTRRVDRVAGISGIATRRYASQRENSRRVRKPEQPVCA